MLEHWVGSHRLQDKVVAELLEDALYEDIYTVSGQHRKLELLNFDIWTAAPTVSLMAAISL